MKRTLLLLMFCVPVFTVRAQQDSVSFFRMRYENDLFTQTDRYYTQGIKLEYGLPGTYGKHNSQYSIGLEQNCFTPKSIRDSFRLEDRPYAGMALFSFSSNIYQKARKLSLITTISLGAMGPCALCEQEQKALHGLLDNVQPLGWERQLKTGFLFNYAIMVEKEILSFKGVDFSAMTQLRAGTLYDDIGQGFQLRFGKMEISKASRYAFFFFTKTMVKLVGYNSMLQGSMFNRNDNYALSVKSIERTVGMLSYGVSFTVGKITLHFSQTMLTPEINQGLFHGWGTCSLTIGNTNL